MKNDKILQITNDVSWIGILDKDIVTFDVVMETEFGTTYNSYFIDAAKKVIIDTAKETFKATYLDKVKKVVKPENIEYIVTNHTEPDHSGNIKHLLSIAPKAIVVGSRQAINYLTEIINAPFKSQIVKDGETLDLGNKTLKFVGAPNLHWPDTIYTFLEQDRLLFTCDSFGAHFCNDKMFDDEVGDYSDSFKYYFDVILRPYSKFMLKAIEKIQDLDIKMICPGHGPILRSTWKEKIEKSKKYSEVYLADAACSDNKILITYVSAYGYTKEMAELISKGISEVVSNPVQMVDIETIQLGELEQYIVNSSALLVGSPTINKNTLLPIYKMFALINPLRDKGKKAAAFGSYGWSGEAVRLIENHLRGLKLDVVCEGISSRFYPGSEKSEQMIDFGRNFAKTLS